MELPDLTDGELAAQLRAHALMLGGEPRRVLDEAARRLDPPVGYEIDEAQSLIVWRGVEVPLTVGEFRMVNRLIRSIDRRVPLADLYAAYLGHDRLMRSTTLGSNVRSGIKRIRYKFREIDPEFNHIVCIAKLGYVWRKLPKVHQLELLGPREAA